MIKWIGISSRDGLGDDAGGVGEHGGPDVLPKTLEVASGLFCGATACSVASLFFHARQETLQNNYFDLEFVRK